LLATLRDIAVLAAGVGLFVICLTGTLILLNVNRSLDVVHDMLVTSDRELRQTLPEVRQTAQEVHQIVSQVNHRVMEADQLVTSTGEAVSSWRLRAWDALRAPATTLRHAWQRRRWQGAGGAGGDRQPVHRSDEEEYG
jgi:uncharacterized protein YoxC